MKDPVQVLLEDYAYDPEKILASARGEAYVAIMLAKGQIGVCSTLGKPIETDPLLLTKPDLKARRAYPLRIANPKIRTLLTLLELKEEPVIPNFDGRE